MICDLKNHQVIGTKQNFLPCDIPLLPTILNNLLSPIS